jgi:hypothetical protein
MAIVLVDSTLATGEKRAQRGCVDNGSKSDPDYRIAIATTAWSFAMDRGIARYQESGAASD